MERENFVISSQFDGLALHGLIVKPEKKPKGILQITHGMCEYKERYLPFMEFFASHGYLVVCHDQRGHGDSVKAEEDRGYFYEYSGEAIVQDAAQITTYIKQLYPNLPVVLFGHSMGSMVARCYLQKYDTLIDKAIICGSPSSNPMVDVAICLTKLIRLFKGKKYRSKMLAYLSTGKGNNRFAKEGPGNWLSRNRQNIEEYLANPKSNYRFTTNGFENLFKLMKHTYQKKRYKVQNPTLPIRFVSGGDDAILVNEKKWQQSIDALKKAGYQNVTGKLYEKFRHEIFNDIGKEVVLEDLLSFIENE